MACQQLESEHFRNPRNAKDPGCMSTGIVAHKHRSPAMYCDFCLWHPPPPKFGSSKSHSCKSDQGLIKIAIESGWFFGVLELLNKYIYSFCVCVHFISSVPCILGGLEYQPQYPPRAQNWIFMAGEDKKLTCARYFCMFFIFWVRGESGAKGGAARKNKNKGKQKG